MANHSGRVYKKSEQWLEKRKNKLNQVIEKINITIPEISDETRSKLTPDHYREGRRAYEATKKISTRHLKPVYRLVLARLYTSQGLWVDSDALGYINNKDEYCDILGRLDLTNQLNTALSHINEYLRGSDYRLDKIKIGRRIMKIRLERVS